MKMIIKQKVTVVILGFLCCVVLLEIGLRIGGFVFSTLQERRNITSLKQKGTYHIMCLGDSTTADGGGYSWPSQLEGILNRSKTGVKFSVINKGFLGINTSYILEHLDENLHEYAPDMIIAMMGITDGETADVRVYKDIPIETYKLVKLLRKNIKDKIREMKIYKQEIMFKKAKGLNSKNGNMAYSELGDYFIKQGKYDKAEAILKKAIEQNPGNDMAYVELGRSYIIQEEPEKAEAILKKAIKQNPIKNMAYIDLARCFIKQGKYGKAEEILKKAIEQNSMKDIAYAELGRCYSVQGKYDKAEAILKKAIEQNPENGMAYVGLGRCYNEQRKYGKAEEMLKKAIELNYKKDAQFELDRGYIEQGKPDKAGAIFRKAIKQTPGDDNVNLVPDRIHFELERCYKEQGKYDEAEAILKKAIEQNPKNDNAYSELALLYETMGKNKLAQEYHQKAEEIRLQRANLITRHNYQELKRKLDKRGIKLVCVQYPMRSVELLKKTLEPYKDIVFVDNEKLFKDALKQGDYDDYFVDICAVDFGHATPKGNRLLATNIANVVLREYFK